MQVILGKTDWMNAWFATEDACPLSSVLCPISWCWSRCTEWSLNVQRRRRCVKLTSRPCWWGGGRLRTESSVSRCPDCPPGRPPVWGCCHPRWEGWCLSGRCNNWGDPSVHCNHNSSEPHRILTEWTCWSSWRELAGAVADVFLIWLEGEEGVSPRRCCWIWIDK